MVKLNKIYLLLGSNIEPRFKYLEEAEQKITELIGDIIQRSEAYESEPLGFNADQAFLNRVVLISSKLKAVVVLDRINVIELGFGRKRSPGKYASRTIDIDILYFNDEIINTEILTVPHPRMHERRFTLKPLVEIAPDVVHPVLNIDNKNLLELCLDDSDVDVFKTTNDR